MRTAPADPSLQQAPEPPRLSGDLPAATRVLQALRAVREQGEGPDIVSSGRVRAIEVGQDEAVLTLRLGGGRCGSAQVLAELAFDVMREQLPDLDLYLRHEHSGGCPNH
ncbi:MAG: iron-sulfur cluster assembly protein [Sphaerotilus natans]